MTKTPLFLLASMAMTACATTGATFRSGVGDKFLEHPPYYAGAKAEAVARDTGKIGHLPIAFQRGATQPAGFDPRSSSGSAIDALLVEMNAYLDSLGVSARLVEGTRGSTVVQASAPIPPDVRFGCAPELGLPGNDCAERGDSALGRKGQTMQLSVGRPSAEWIARTRDLMDDNGASRALVITLEVGQYLPRQEGWRGDKIVELGSGHNAKLPWLTSLETPVSVLQLTGAVMDREGKALRIGAEGFYAHRTRLMLSAIGAQELLTDEDVKNVRTARRSDLAGEPLAWKVAMRELVARLTGR